MAFFVLLLYKLYETASMLEHKSNLIIQIWLQNKKISYFLWDESCAFVLTIFTVFKTKIE